MKISKFLKNTLIMGLTIGVMVGFIFTSVRYADADRSFSLPDQTGQAGKFLETDGTNPLWASVAGGTGTVTSITAGTGLLGSPNPITTTGTLSLDSSFVPYTAIVAPTGGNYNTLGAAVTAVCGAGGGSIYVKDGTYTETATIVGCTSLRITLSQGAIEQFNGSIVTTAFSAASGSSRIIIEGGKWLQTQSTAQGTAFDMSNLSNTYIQNVRVEEFGIATLYNDTASTTFYNSINNAQYFDDNNCVEYVGTQANSNSIDNLRCRPKAGGAGTGLTLVAARGITVKDSDFEPATLAGITGVSIDATSRQISLLNDWIENNATGITVANGAGQVNLFGTTITGNTTDINDLSADSNFIGASKTGTLASWIDLNVPSGISKVAARITQNNNNTGLLLTNAGTANGISLVQTGNTSSSVSTGGAFNITNTANTGPAEVVYSNQASPAGRLFIINADNPTFNQTALRVIQNGTGNAQDIVNTNVVGGGAGARALSVTTDSGGGTTNGAHALDISVTGSGNTNASAINAVSSNQATSAVQISGVESGRGTIKVTHTGTGADGNASALSIDLQGTGTAAQGIFMTSTTGGTTGKLLDLRNDLGAGQVELLTFTSNGNMGIQNATPTARLELPAGTQTPSTASLKIDSGTLLTTTEGGAIEHASGHLYFTDTNGGTRFQLDQQSGTAYTAGSGLSLSGNAFSLDLTSANVFTALQTVNKTALGTSTVDGLFVENTTAATVGAQQISPSIHWEGQGWGTTAPASASVDFRANVLPVQATVPLGTWQLQDSINGGAYANALQVTSAGAVTATANFTSLANASSIAFQSTSTALNSNFLTIATGTSTTTQSNTLFAGASTISYRTLMAGSTASAPGIGTSATGLDIANQTINIPGSGTSALFAQMVINPITIGAGAGTLTTSASLYINGAATGATNNYALDVASGASLFGGNVSMASSSITATQTVVNCSTSGTVTFSEPEQGSSYKNVIAYETACLGTASYTYPVAFTNTPDSLGLNAAKFTSISTSATTVTGTTTTGFSQLYGY